MVEIGGGLPRVLAAALVLPLFSQPAADIVTLRSNTRLVQLDVIAEDRHGHAITNLTRDNFEIYDQGRKQQIRIFTKDSPEADPGLRPPASGVDDGAFTNMAEARSGPGTVTVILIDSLNTRWVNQAYARKQLLRFLEQIHPEDHIAIYSMGFAGFHVLHDFTQNASDLVAKLATLKGDVNAPRPAGGSTSRPDLGQQLAQWLNGRSPDVIENQLLGDSGSSAPAQALKILTAIANQLASIPGRKNIIWISDGFPPLDWSGLADAAYAPSDVSAKMSRKAESTHADRERGAAEPASFANEMKAAMRTISDDNVAIYPVNSAGLDNPTYDAQNAGRSSMRELSFQDVHARENAMDDIARKTGGRAFYETNDLALAIRTAVEDSKTTYTLGFYPDLVESNGKFHTVKIKVAGRTDVRLRYRQGYIDSADPSRSETDRKARLEQAAWSPLDANGIGLSAKIDGKRIQLRIRTSDLSSEQSGAARIVEADLLIVQKDERGQQLDAIEQAIRIEAGAKRYEELTRTGVLLNRDFTLHRDAHSLRIVVSDVPSGRLGSISIAPGVLPR